MVGVSFAFQRYKRRRSTFRYSYPDGGTYFAASTVETPTAQRSRESIKENSMKRIFLVSILVLMLLTVFTVGTPIAAAQDRGAEPAAGPAGTIFTFHIGGFDRGERVAYWLNTPNSTILAIGDRGTNASGGKILVSWESRAGIPLGFWQFVARGVDSGEQKVVTFEVTGGGNAPAPGGSNVLPPVGSTGTTFTFYASGFTADERVGYWLNSPAGAVVTIDDQQHYANSDGQFSATWMAPAAVTPGTWQLVAQGTESGVLQVIAFQIQ
jgi:hypothetical protein